MRGRAWLLLTALAVLLVGSVVAIGTFSGGLPRADPPRPPADRSEGGVQRGSVVLSVDVTAAGTVWLTTVGTDCGGCVLVWRRGTEDGDEWFPLRQVGSDHLPAQIRMADSGGDGLIGGGGLWSTRDGGDNWVQETSVPVAAGDEVQVEAAGGSRWALVRPPVGRPSLWRARAGGSRWREVALPPGDLDPEAAPVAADDGLLLWVAGEDGPRPTVTADGQGWSTLTSPCQVGTTTAYATCPTRRGLQLLVRQGDTWETWPLAAALGPARNLSPVAAAESVATNAAGTGYAVVRGNLVVTHDRGLGGWARVE